MMTLGLGHGNIDLRFNLINRTNGWFRTQTVESIGYGSSVIDDRPVEFYLDVNDINRIISALQKLKEDCGYKLES